MLVRLDLRIERSQNWINSWVQLGEPIQDFQNGFTDAQRLIDNAEKSWRNGEYTTANELINQAYKLLDKIPQPPISVCTPGTTSTSQTVDESGVFKTSVTATSSDERLWLSVDKGTTGRTGEGKPLTYMSINIIDTPLPPPRSYSILYPVYELGPKGVTFNPPITVSFLCEPGNLPKGIGIGDLFIASLDEETNKWNILSDSSVDQKTNTVTASLDHFTLLAVLYSIPLPTPPVNWWLIGAIIVSGIIVAFIAKFLTRRRD